MAAPAPPEEPTTAPAESPATAPTLAPGQISLNFPDNVDLKTLVDYVSRRLDFNVIYQDEQLSKEHVTIRAPARIPADDLLGLLKDLLKVKGFALVDGEQPGWKRVVRTADVPAKEQESPIHFYKLANATASDVLETIRALEGEQSGPESRPPSSSQRGPNPATPTGITSVGPGTLSSIGSSPSAGPNYGSGAGTGFPSAAGQTPPTGLTAPGPGVTNAAPGEPTSPAIPAGLRTKNATVAADPNTNTIIVVAKPDVQKLYEELIKALDKRRPQVLIEATIVTLDTSHGFTFGVEVSGHSKPGASRVVTFSSFGFSTPDPTTGQLALMPGVGFNGSVIGSDLADVIVRALATSNRARVSSAPRILVNDNATGTLSSITQAPYTTTNIGTTISTTSFGGYAQAGTTVTLTPHISESDYLQLEYQVSLSSFTDTGNAANGIPPGIQQDSVQSKVTIPDGSTVVVGGLNRSNYSRMVSSIPLLDQIPILKYLFSSHNNNDEQITLFVFLRPVILRDDQFQDLKYLSERDLKDAGIPAGMPSSEPIAIR